MLICKYNITFKIENIFIEIKATNSNLMNVFINGEFWNFYDTRTWSSSMIRNHLVANLLHDHLSVEFLDNSDGKWAEEIQSIIEPFAK